MTPSVAIERKRYTVHEFHRMAEVGVLEPDRRVELLEGEVLYMMGIGKRHARVTRRITRRFPVVFEERAHCRHQQPPAT